MSELPNQENKPLLGKQLTTEIISALKDALALNITTIDLQGLSGPADWFVICEGDNTVHNRACADRVFLHLKENFATRPWQREGIEEGRWILLDYSDVIVHIMLDELRGFYNLEKLWKEGSISRIENENEQ